MTTETETDTTAAMETTDTPTEQVISIEQQLTDLISQLETIAKTVRGLSSITRNTRKQVIKERKALRGKKKRVVDPNRPKKEPSGFARPTDISDELSDFLELDRGLQIARTEVTKRITAFIKSHDLQNPENRRQIDLVKPVAQPLKDLLNPDQPLTFFNLQRYLKPHFPPSKASLLAMAKKEQAAAAKVANSSENESEIPANSMEAVRSKAKGKIKITKPKTTRTRKRAVET